MINIYFEQNQFRFLIKQMTLPTIMTKSRLNFLIILFTGGVFTEEIIKDMSSFNEQPIIFALR